VKIAVISDTHGSVKECINTLLHINNIDKVIHLGDNTNDAVEIASITQIETIFVKGNCDVYDHNTPEEMLIELNSKKILITHGHKYNVKSGLNNLYYRGKELGVDVVLFGHSHNPLIVDYDNIIFFNPGSTTLPRACSKKSIGIIEVGEKIEAKLLKIK